MKLPLCRISAASVLFSVCVSLVVGSVAAAKGKQTTADDADFDFKLPSTVTLTSAGSSNNTRSGSIGARFMLPHNYWVELAGDRSIEKTEDLETRTVGGALTFGTDPLAVYSLDIGVDAFGVDDQYRVQEGRVRLTIAPESFFGHQNPGFDLALEYRSAKLAFTVLPNSIFTTTKVEYDVRTARLELGWYGWAPWTFRVFGEKSELPDNLTNLARPLAPLFVPEAAISTGTSWPSEESGLSLGYSRDRWGTNLSLSQRRSFVTGERTGLSTLTANYDWTSTLNSGIRFTSSRSLDDPNLEPIHTLGLDFTISY